MAVPLRDYNYYPKMKYPKKNNRFPWKNLIIIIETLLLIVITIKYVPMNEVLKEIQNKANIAAMNATPTSVFNEMTREDYKFLQNEKDINQKDRDDEEEFNNAIKTRDISIISGYQVENQKRIADLETISVNQKFNQYIYTKIEIYKLQDKVFSDIINKSNNDINRYIDAMNELNANLMKYMETALKNMNVSYTKEDDGTIWYTVPSEYHIGMGK